jgi:hypothetical protein
VSLHESFVDDGLGLKGKSKRKVVMGNVCSASRVLHAVPHFFTRVRLSCCQSYAARLLEGRKRNERNGKESFHLFPFESVI